MVTRYESSPGGEWQGPLRGRCDGGILAENRNHCVALMGRCLNRVDDKHIYIYMYIHTYIYIHETDNQVYLMGYMYNHVWWERMSFNQFFTGNLMIGCLRIGYRDVPATAMDAWSSDDWLFRHSHLNHPWNKEHMAISLLYMSTLFLNVFLFKYLNHFLSRPAI